MNKNMKKALKIIGVIIIILIILFDVPERIYWEILTRSHAEEFKNPELYWDFMPCKTLDEIMVLEYTSDYAEVFYVHDDYQNAYVAELVKEDGKWVNGDGGRILWAKEHTGGNADYPSEYWWLFKFEDKNIHRYSREIYDENDVIRNPDSKLYK